MRNSRVAMLGAMLGVGASLSSRGNEILVIDGSDMGFDSRWPLTDAWASTYDAPFRRRPVVQPAKEITQSDLDRIEAACAKRARKAAKRRMA